MSDAIEIAHGPFGRVALLDMDRGLVRHAHPHCHVLLKVEGDDTQFLVGERIVSLTDAQAVLVNAWETHAYVHDAGRDKAVILALYIEPAWLGEFRSNWAASAAPGFFAEPIGSVTQAIRRFAHDLAAEMITAPGSSRIQDDLLSGLMVAVLERFTAWRDVGTSLRDLARRGGPDHRIRRAMRRMREEPGLIDGVEALARDAGLSRAHFYRLFEQSTGAPPHVFLNGIRVERAVAAIVEGSSSPRSSGGRGRSNVDPSGAEPCKQSTPIRGGAHTISREMAPRRGSRLHSGAPRARDTAPTCSAGGSIVLRRTPCTQSTKSPTAAVASGPSSRRDRSACPADTIPRSSPRSPSARRGASPAARACRRSP